jgi:hypothetical protein
MALASAPLDPRKLSTVGEGLQLRARQLLSPEFDHELGAEQPTDTA